MLASLESSITIQLVHGGFILTAPGEDTPYKTEIFNSQAKLMKAVKAAVEQNSLVKKTSEKTDAQGEAE